MLRRQALAICCLLLTGRLPGLSGKFQQVAILGPADFIGEVVATKHKFTAVAECQCDLLWLKPQELHMLGPKSLTLAMQYTALREKRWQKQQKQASALPDIHYMQDAADHESASLEAAVLKRWGRCVLSAFVDICSV